MSDIKDFRARFAFHTTPFTRELPVKDRFRPQSWEQTLAQLGQVISDRMSAALIAPAGCGKTTLLRALRANLAESRYRVSYLKVTDLSKRDFCRELSHALGLERAGTYPVLVRRLQQHLEEGFQQEAMRWVIILDEAQEFRADVLGIMRILTNFEMDSRLLVSLILAGQPPLETMLDREALRAVSDRLALRARLALLSATELDAYVRHRCTIAGATTSPFDAEAVTAIYEIGRGNLRATDRLALKALYVAHEADANRVDTNHIIAARALL